MNQRIEPFRCFGLMINCSIELSRKFVQRRKCIMAIELRESLFQVKNNVNTMPIHMVNCAYMSGLTVRLVFSKKMPIVLLRKEFIGLSLKSFCSSFFCCCSPSHNSSAICFIRSIETPFLCSMANGWLVGSSSIYGFIPIERV